MARLFDAYVTVDWSASEAKKTGEQSVWIGVAKRDARFHLRSEVHNPATRAEAAALLRKIIADLRRRGDRILLGFDFALGYPAGTAQRLGLTGAPWSATWSFLAKNVVDKPDNTNNRFAVAAKMNRLMTDEGRPFWGAPPRYAQRWLTATKPAGGYGDVPEFRATETAAISGKRRPASVWQLMGAGAVGGQTILGIPVVGALMEEMGETTAVWPFGTGWRTLGPEDVAPLSVLAVEIWPTLYPFKAEAGEPRDAAQVRGSAEHFARLDEKGELSALFAPPKEAAPALIRQVEDEEGWILGA
ncbi:cobalamin biosynthesis protein CbiG [Brevundimonas sp. 2R-24]|uniref:Cobalamin biosynthesis protein CbiG n=1 Tax=Peiella sedimenti TaxID=3061083 RepID=A0ABT8SI43_9CAUL|nr:cobalamin biosynthesis protein CbiG [Caulobacteraceae bacterium XZ-24]